MPNLEGVTWTFSFSLIRNTISINIFHLHKPFCPHKIKGCRRRIEEKNKAKQYLGKDFGYKCYQISKCQLHKNFKFFINVPEYFTQDLQPQVGGMAHRLHVSVLVSSFQIFLDDLVMNTSKQYMKYQMSRSFLT